jgi:hypothetical protein
LPWIGFNVEILTEIALEDFFCIILCISRQILYSVNYTAGSSGTTSGVMFRQGTHCWSINLVIWCLAHGCTRRWCMGVDKTVSNCLNVSGKDIKCKTKGNPEVTKETNQSPKFAWSAGLLANIYLAVR